MKRWHKTSLSAIALGVVAVLLSAEYIARARAHDLITNPVATRRMPHKTPADFHLAFDDVTVTSDDGHRLVGWYVPSHNRAVIIFLHGYKDHRGSMLGAAAMYSRHGYGVLLATVRAHDHSDGEMITFGHEEMRDVDAWYRFVAGHDGVETNAILLLGVSMGGSLAIQYGAQNPRIAAVVADSAFSSLDDTVETSVKFFTGLPPFPFAPMIRFWAEREGGYRFADVDAKTWIGRISPRPVFLMQGGADVVISAKSGERLYAAAGAPKELWYEPAVGHAQFFDKLTEEYERRVVGWVDRQVEAIQPRR
jgi:fermentation-respiration switch protein FrsA (DUF1100 family)